MPDPGAELYAIQSLADLTVMNITNIRDAKSVLGPTERGIDVVLDLDGQTIGAQHTTYHGDEGLTPGTRGSLIRAQEEETAKRNQSAFSLWINPDYRQALALRIQEKCVVAARHDNSDVLAESWLVVSAGLPRPGAVASTIIVPSFVDTTDLNRLSHDILSASRFQRAYLVLHIGRKVFGWNRQEGWCVVDAGKR